MKKTWLFFWLAWMPLLFSCSTGTREVGEVKGNVDYGHDTYYDYKNESSWDLTVKTCHWNDQTKGWYLSLGMDSEFTIPRGGSHLINFWGLGGPNMMPPIFPFQCEYRIVHTIVRNDTAQVIQWYGRNFIDDRPQNDKLYLLENYALVSECGLTRRYEYIFTDDFLEDAGPIVDYDYGHVYYSFKNESSWDLTVNGCFWSEENSWSQGANKWIIVGDDKSFTLNRGDSHAIISSYGGFGYPFRERPGLITGRMVRNGTEQVVQREEYVIDGQIHRDKLFQLENYTLVSEKKDEKTYEFIFTDDFFADAEPIVP